MAATLDPGAGVSALAPAAGIHPSQMHGWQRQLCSPTKAVPGFAAVRIAQDAASTPLPGLIDIKFTTVRITGAVDLAALVSPGVRGADFCRPRQLGTKQSTQLQPTS